MSRVVVAIETLDQNDNAPELDRQYTTSVCDSSAPGQVLCLMFLSINLVFLGGFCKENNCIKCKFAA